MKDLIIHSNKTPWGYSYHIISDGGKGHIGAIVEEDDPNTLYIRELSVIPEARGNGLGKRLIDEAEKLAKDLGRYRLRLNVDKPINWVYDFYMKLGYEFWDSDNDTVYLVKYLKS